MRAIRSMVCGLCVLAALTSHTEARAQDMGATAIDVGIGVAVLSGVALDVTFFVMDGVAFHERRPLTTGWAVGELIVGVFNLGPGLVATGAGAVLARGTSDYYWQPLVPGIALTSIGLWFVGHSIWSLAKGQPVVQQAGAPFSFTF